ncbi:MAG: hypothetical protein ACR2M3_15855 [Thermomicrobiales bacterium]
MDTASAPVSLSRRSLLQGAAAVAATALLAACRTGRSAATPALTRIGAYGTASDAGNVAAVRAALAAPPFVHNTAWGFYLLPATSDSVIAVSWRCPVEGCTVPPPSPALGGNLGCPCCGAMYDGRRGTVLRGPTNRPAEYVARPLDWMPVRIAGGNVIVDTEAIAMRTGYDPRQTTPLG